MMLTIEELENRSKSGCVLFDTGNQLKEHIYALSGKAFAKGDQDRDDIRTIAQMKARQAFVRERFIRSVGGLPDSGAPLHDRITGTEYFDGYRIEKIIYESRPGNYVTANLYLPDGLTKPTAAVLFVCGHHGEAKQADEYQIVCQYLVRAGMIVLAQDPIGQGERFSYYEKALGKEIIEHCCPEHDYVGFQNLALGESLARYFVHDAMRSIDYLMARPEVDKDKIGVTGNSGGGTQTSMMMMADERIAAAVPATFIMNRQSYMATGQAQDREQIWPGLTELGIDHEDIVAEMAPKPVLILAVDHDFFPIEGTTRTFNRCKRLWRLFDAEDQLQLFSDYSDHHYTCEMAQKAAAFLAKHLLSKDIARIDDKRVKPAPQLSLRCTRSGQVRGEIEGARFVYHENQDTLKRLSDNRHDQSEAKRQANAVAFLQDKVFKNRSPVELYVKKTWPTVELQELLCDSIIWYAQANLFNHAYIFRKFEHGDNPLPVTIALWDGGTARMQAHYEWIRQTCSQDRAVMVLDATGLGMVEQRLIHSGQPLLAFYGTMFKLNDDLIWLSDSLAAMRVYDLIKSLDVLSAYRTTSDRETCVYTHGRYSVYADIAGLLDARISSVHSDQPMASYSRFVQSRYYDTTDIAGIVLPGLLQYADLDEIRAWGGAGSPT